MNREPDQRGPGQVMTGQHRGVVDRWTGSAAARVDTLALRDPHLARSHRELAETARHRAGLLLSRGLRPDQRVVVMLGSAVEQATWIAAVMLAGGCAVPLGLNQPDQRIADLTRLARPSAVIADERTWLLAEGQVRYDGSDPGVTGPVRLPRPGPDWAAYICFTSGTTGRPKGVVVPHGALAHTTGEMVAYLGLSQRPRTHVLATSWSFDVAMMDLWLALTTGGTLFMPGRDALLGPALAATLSSVQAPILHTVPSLFAGSTAGDLASFPAGTTVMMGGESIPASLLGGFPSSTDAHVVYGITETAVITTATPADRDTPPEIIGRPLPGTECVVVDAAGRPVPDGTLGELVIGGPVVARGYFADPAGTASRFLPGDRGSRRYRSGDLVRRQPDGSLSFHGRTDQQFKIRGHRVEPAEVEQALLNVPGVRQAAIVLAKDPTGDPALIAYLAGDGLEAGTVRQEAATRMPDWMRPRLIHILPTLPISVTGKIDRPALPPPAWPDQATASPAPSGPMTGTEQAIGEIWQQLLGVPELAGESNFIELGGHSLKAAQLSTVLQDRLGVSVLVPDVLAAPNLRELAKLVDGIKGARPQPSAAEAGPRAKAPAVVRQIWLHQELAGEAGLYNLVVTVKLDGELRPTALQRALQLLERAHPALRTSFEFDGDELWTLEHPAAGRPLMVQSTSLAGAVEAAGRRALELDGQPPWTYRLVTTGRGQAVLVLVFHHIAVDGVAIHRLLGELARAYSAVAGPARPGVPISAEPAQAVTDASDPGFWAQMMAGAPAPAALPGQRVPSDFAEFAGWCRPMELPGVPAGLLQCAAADRGTTLHTVLLSAFLRTLARSTGTSDVIIGIPLSRRGIDVRFAAVGQFVSVLPVRFRLPTDLSVAGCLDVVVRTMAEAQRHCTVDPALVLETVRPPGADVVTDPFRVVFAWEDELPSLDFAGLDSSWALEFNGWSEAEMTFEFTRRGDLITGRVIGRRPAGADVDTGGFLRAMETSALEMVPELSGKE